MKYRRIIMLISVFGLTLGITNSLTAPVEKIHYSESYAASVCPPSDSALVSQISVVSKETPYRKVFGKNSALRKIGIGRYSSDGKAILLDQGPMNSIVWQGVSGVWAGATICQAPQGDQWFVGGSANVISRGRIYLVNSGLSDALVDVATWTEKGVKDPKVFSVPANSSIKVALDSIATGSDRLVLRVTPRAGRVNAFLIEERSKGLKGLGGDIVNPTSFPQTDFVISGVPHQIIKGKDAAHVLRFLVPGSASAHVRVDLISTDGIFSPVGLDDVDISAGRVIDIALKPILSASAFSLRIRSDQPILAGVLSSMHIQGHVDIAWNASSPELIPLTLAVRGTSPRIIFTGESISLKISVRLINGKTIRSSVSGSDIVAWKVPDNASFVTLSNIGRAIFATGIISSNSGIAAFPIMQGSALARAAIPSYDIAVINR